MNKLKSKTYTVVKLPVREWVDDLKNHLNHHMIELGYRNFTLADNFYLDTVLWAIDDIIELKSAWIDTKRKYTNTLLYLEKYNFSLYSQFKTGAIFGLICKKNYFNTKYDFMQAISSSIEDYVYLYMIPAIDGVILDNTFDQWKVEEIKKGDYYILVKGTDYRVDEYYRLKNMYEPEEDEAVYDGYDIDLLELARKGMINEHELDTLLITIKNEDLSKKVKNKIIEKMLLPSNVTKYFKNMVEKESTHGINKDYFVMKTVKKVEREYLKNHPFKRLMEIVSKDTYPVDEKYIDATDFKED